MQAANIVEGLTEPFDIEETLEVKGHNFPWKSELK